QVSFMSRLRRLAAGILGDELADPAHPLGGHVGVSPNSCAIRPAQPRMPNCCTARLIAVVAISAVEASDGCSPEQNKAWQRTPFMSSSVTVICVVVDISHHPVLLVSRV